MQSTAGAVSGADDGTPRYFDLVLLAIALLCLIPRVVFGASQFIEYDGYWHVWIAQQDNWANFLREYQANAHPPLYFLLLRVAFWFGRTNLTYRGISILSGTASVYLLGRTAWKAMRSPVWAALAALAYGLSLPSILVSNEVRTYMLSACLVQVSFYYFLDLIREDGPATMRPRIIFAVTASLACLTEYYALIYAGAALLAALIVPLVRRHGQWMRAVLRELLTFALILALPIAEYVTHFGTKSVAYDHLPTYYFQPDGAESAGEFVLRNIRNEVNWFSPWQIPEGTAFYAMLALLIVVAIVIVVLVRRLNSGKNLAALLILAFPLVMMGAIIFGALVRAYPFGGYLRQQYVLFPFLVICPFLLLDRLLSGAPRTAVYVIAGLLTIGVGVVSAQNYNAWPKQSKLLMGDQVGRYRRMFPAPQAIYIDQFNLITFFMYHHDWHWNFVAPVPGSKTVDTYQLSRDGHSMYLFRDKEHWNLDLRDPLLFSQMARGMKEWHLGSTTIFGLAQPAGRARTEAQVAAYRARVAELTAAEGLCVQTLELDNYDVYAEFRTAGTCAVQ